MSEIFVRSSSDIEQIINKLKQQNEELRERKQQLDTEKNTLCDLWQGEASQAFSNRYEEKIKNLVAFSELIDTYVQGLTKIKTEYENAEAANKAIASR